MAGVTTALDRRFIMLFKNCRNRQKRREGFTLIEVLVALTIIVMAGSALLLATYAAMDMATDSLDQTIAQGIARQFLDEAMGLSYAEPGSDPLSNPLGPESGEAARAGRFESFDDTDDFANYQSHPLQDPWGKPLGTGDDQGNLRHPSFQLNPHRFTNWSLTSTVVYVDENDPTKSLSADSTSGMRAIEVSIYKRDAEGSDRLLVNMRRVYSHVPSPQ
jgi:prepilin-type N-terminal cleavage/methylation domain-containing protein